MSTTTLVCSCGCGRPAGVGWIYCGEVGWVDRLTLVDLVDLGAMS